MKPKDVLGFAKDRGAVMVDLKFMDFLGLWQHFTIPLGELKEEIFEEGLGFDGSSIRGWAEIHASDMLVMPDPTTAVMDPFMKDPDAEPDLQHRRSHHQGALRPRPAQHRHQGGEVPQVHRARRHRVLRPRGRVLHLRRGALRQQAQRRRSTRSTPARRAWNTRQGGAATSATRSATRRATSRSPRWTASRTSAPRCAGCWRTWASRSSASTTRWPPPARRRSTSASTPW